MDSADVGDKITCPGHNCTPKRARFLQYRLEQEGLIMQSHMHFARTHTHASKHACSRADQERYHGEVVIPDEFVHSCQVLKAGREVCALVAQLPLQGRTYVGH